MDTLTEPPTDPTLSFQPTNILSNILTQQHTQRHPDPTTDINQPNKTLTQRTHRVHDSACLLVSWCVDGSGEFVSLMECVCLSRCVRRCLSMGWLINLCPSGSMCLELCRSCVWIGQWVVLQVNGWVNQWVGM